MAGRYPFDASSGRGHPQLNSAQVRAALGLTSQVDEAAAYLQAHAQRQQQQQQDFLQLLLQEQLEQQVQAQQFRSIGEQLQDFPEIQQHYQNLLIRDQINRQRQEEVARAELRFQEELRRQRLSLITEERQTSLTGPSPPPSLQNVATLQSPPGPSAVNISGVGGIRGNAEPNRAHSQPSVSVSVPKQTIESPPRFKVIKQKSEAVPVVPVTKPPRKKRAPSTASSDIDVKPKAKRAKKTTRTRTPTPTIVVPPKETKPSPQPEKPENESLASSSVVVVEDEAQEEEPEEKEVSEPIIRKGTIETILGATEIYGKMEECASILQLFGHVEWSDSEDDSEDDMIEFSTDPTEKISTAHLKSALPVLPQEPLYDEDAIEKEKALLLKKSTEKEDENKADNKGDKEGANDPTLAKNGESERKKLSALFDYPVPIDTWWPSLNGMRRERRNAGETSDEDTFEETSTERTLFRANEPKIRARLSKLLEPGYLEKLPHCRIHRVRTRRKKNSSAPEFVYCWQVTEIYPNEVMVCCTKCGTWRHPACGGHYDSFSTRENTKEVFSPVCEACREEERYLAEYPIGAGRIERQRMEQLRRALATAAVMRQASFSKHGGTYKWPLGSVSATHIAGHTRSVHARHDKAEKQWSDMGLRLSRGFGYRPKERVKSRTKELERLMVSVEDAEAYTERHNMLHFLMRDTARPKPVGFENVLVNLFDPDGHLDLDRHEEEQRDEGDEGKGVSRNTGFCVRKGCNHVRRFDSLFCSDACGVSALEQDLMQTLFEASEIHPSVLRP